MSIKELFRDLVQAKWSKRKTKPRMKTVRVRYPLNAERDYSKYLLGLLAHIDAPIARKVTQTSWKRWTSEYRGVHDASTALLDGHSQDLAALNTEMLERQGEVMLANPERARKGAFAAILKYGQAVDDLVAENINDFTQYLIGQAFDLNNQWTAEAVAEWATSNYERITSLTSQHISQVNVLLREGVAYGTGWQEIAEKIEKLTGATKNRAKLIAVDQIAKLTSNLTRYRQQTLGISAYTWRTSRDERVRASHKVMEGVLCSWENPDVFSKDEGATWLPKTSEMEQQQVGQAIRCRCHGEPFVDDIIAEGGAFLSQIGDV